MYYIISKVKITVCDSKKFTFCFLCNYKTIVIVIVYESFHFTIVLQGIIQ